MRILFFGDVFGRPGREALGRILPRLRKTYSADFVIANAENLAHGKGINRDALDEARRAGVDFFTSGNHVWEGADARTILTDNVFPIVRPANYPPGAPGRGWSIVDVAGERVCVFNLLGRVFMRQNTDDPFRKADEVLSALPEDLKVRIVDFHAEASSEKVALGWYLDGRVSAVLGTHTHVPTADLKILPKGTAYVSDVGMVGPRNSVIGKNIELSLTHFLTQLPGKFEVAEGPVDVNGVFLDIDERDGKAARAERIHEVVGI